MTPAMPLPVILLASGDADVAERIRGDLPALEALAAPGEAPATRCRRRWTC